MSKVIEKNYQGLRHQTLLGMTQDAVDVVAGSNEHEALFRDVVKKAADKPKEEKKVQIPAPPTEVAERGRILTFTPTKERVTLTRAKVGQNYNGVWVHEVTSRTGQKFLASENQLKKL